MAISVSNDSRAYGAGVVQDTDGLGPALPPQPQSIGTPLTGFSPQDLYVGSSGGKPKVVLAQVSPPSGNNVKSSFKDPDYASGANYVLNSPMYSKASPAVQAKVQNDLSTLERSPSYAAASGKMKEMLPKIVGSMSLSGASNPGNKVMNNTVDQVLSGRVTLNLYDQAPNNNPNDPLNASGYTSDSQNIHVNINPQVKNPLFGTIAHETNHALNGDASVLGDSDRFLAEYRAHLASERASGGEPQSPQAQAALQSRVLKMVQSRYPEYPALYNSKSDPSFNAAVDGLNKDLAAGKPVDPEQLRQLYQTAYGSSASSYVSKQQNTDNSK